MALFPWLLLGASLLLFAQAWRVLSTDARGGHYVTMGGSGLFSGHWLLGSAAGAWGGTLLLALPWYVGVGLFAGLYVLKGAVYRVIVAANLGREAS